MATEDPQPGNGHGPDAASAKDLRGKVLLVTGAYGGIGGAVVRLAASRGASVVAIGRKKRALERLDDRLRAAGCSATLLPMDVLDADKLDRVGLSVYQRFGRLDGVLHAAGALGPLTPTHQLDPAVFERCLAVHALSAQRLLRAVEPALRGGEGGSFVLLTDASIERVPGPAGQPFAACYRAAKAAVNALGRSLQAERTPGLRVHLVDPGPTDTALRWDLFVGEAKGTQPPPDAKAPQLVEMLLEGAEPAQGILPLG